MRTFTLLLALFALANSYPLRLIKAPSSDSGFLPDDAKKCVADLKFDSEALLSAWKVRDWLSIAAIVQGSAKDFIDCQSVLAKDIPACVAPINGALGEIKNLIKYVTSLDTNADDYGTAIRSFAAWVERAAHECFDYNGPQPSA